MTPRVHEECFSDASDLVAYVATHAPDARALPELASRLDFDADRHRVWLDETRCEVWIAWRWWHEWGFPGFTEEEDQEEWWDWRVLHAATAHDVRDVSRTMQEDAVETLFFGLASPEDLTGPQQHRDERTALEQWQSVHLAALRSSVIEDQRQISARNGPPPLTPSEVIRAVDTRIRADLDGLRDEIHRLRLLRAHHLHGQFGHDRETPGRPGSASRAAAALGLDHSDVSALFSAVGAHWDALERQAADAVARCSGSG